MSYRNDRYLLYTFSDSYFSSDSILKPGASPCAIQAWPALTVGCEHESRLTVLNNVWHSEFVNNSTSWYNLIPTVSRSTFFVHTKPNSIKISQNYAQMYMKYTSGSVSVTIWFVQVVELCSDVKDGWLFCKCTPCVGTHSDRVTNKMLNVTWELIVKKTKQKNNTRAYIFRNPLLTVAAGISWAAQWPDNMTQYDLGKQSATFGTILPFR